MDAISHLCHMHSGWMSWLPDMYDLEYAHTGHIMIPCWERHRARYGSHCSSGPVCCCRCWYHMHEAWSPSPQHHIHIRTIIAAAAAAAAAVVGLDAGASLSWPTTRSWQENPLLRPLQQSTRTNTVTGQVYLCPAHHHRSTW